METRKWLIKYRGNKTHEEVAIQSGVKRQYYSMIENGTRTPSVEVAKRIGNSLGFDWTLFFDEAGNKTLPGNKDTRISKAI